MKMACYEDRTPSGRVTGNRLRLSLTSKELQYLETKYDSGPWELSSSTPESVELIRNPKTGTKFFNANSPEYAPRWVLPATSPAPRGQQPFASEEVPEAAKLWGGREDRVVLVINLGMLDQVPPRPQQQQQQQKRNSQMSTAPKTDNPNLHREVMLQLGETFDKEARRYFLADWDDRRVAKETGASSDYVAHIRETYFGKIKQPGLNGSGATVLKVLGDLDIKITGSLQRASEEVHASIAEAMVEIRKHR